MFKATGLVFDSAHQPALAEPSATTLKDYSRWGNDGTFKADGEPDWVQLPSGLWVMDFDGDDYVDCGAHTSLLPDTFTFECWARLDAKNYSGICSWADVLHPALYPLYDTADPMSIIYLGPLNYKILEHSPVDIGDGNMHHLVFVITGNGRNDIDNAQLYADGQIQDTRSVTKTGDPDAKTHFYIGGQHVDFRFDGRLALPRLHRRTLSEAKIGKHFTAETGWFGV